MLTLMQKCREFSALVLMSDERIGLKNRLESSRLPVRIGVSALLAFQLVACSDSPTGINRKMNLDAVDNVLPAVTDARRRVAMGVLDVPVRQKLSIVLAQIELSLKSDDVVGVKRNVDELNTILSIYRVQSVSSDKADLTAIYLVMHSVLVVADPESAARFQF